MIGFALGLLAANASEWVVHKYVLHGLGKKKRSFWSFHWHEHHKASRRSAFYDQDYAHSPLTWNGQGKELLALSAAGALSLPLLPVAPFFVLGVLYSSANYYRVHRRSHLDPEWAKKHVPWHYDHHMGPQQDANWCVTKPWFDHLMGTRKPYLGTKRHADDEARRSARPAPKPQAASFEPAVT